MVAKLSILFSADSSEALNYRLLILTTVLIDPGGSCYCSYYALSSVLVSVFSEPPRSFEIPDCMINFVEFSICPSQALFC